MPRSGHPIRNFRKKLTRRMLVPLEFALVRLGTLILPRLSRKSILRFSRFIGGCAMCFGSVGNRRMQANLRAVYGETQTEAERRALMRGVWNHCSLLILDLFWFLRDTQARIDEYVTIEDSFCELSRGTKGCIGVTAHLGNWEIAANSICENGREVTSVYAPIGGIRVTQHTLQSARQLTGQHLVPRQGAAIHLVRAIRQGNVVGMLLDQFTKVNDGGMFVDILGLPAPISKIAGVLHGRLQCPIHVVACVHTGNGYYRAFQSAMLPAEAPLSEEETTQWVADRISELIRQYPEQWLWMYRRWRHIKPGSDPARYPYYAHSFNPLVD